jgi:hypothetical protein
MECSDEEAVRKGSPKHACNQRSLTEYIWQNGEQFDLQAFFLSDLMQDIYI